MSLRERFQSNEENRKAILKASELETINMELSDYAARLKQKIEQAVERASYRTQAEYESHSAYDTAITKPLRLTVKLINNQQYEITRETLEAMEGYRALHAILKSKDVDMACRVQIGNPPPEKTASDYHMSMNMGILGLMGAFGEGMEPKKPEPKSKMRKPVGALYVNIVLDQPYQQSYLQIVPVPAAAASRKSGKDRLTSMMIGHTSMGKAAMVDEIARNVMGNHAFVFLDANELAQDGAALAQNPNVFTVLEHPVPAPASSRIVHAGQAKMIGKELESIRKTAAAVKLKKKR